MSRLTPEEKGEETAEELAIRLYEMRQKKFEETVSEVIPHMPYLE